MHKCHVLILTTQYYDFDEKNMGRIFLSSIHDGMEMSYPVAVSFVGAGCCTPRKFVVKHNLYQPFLHSAAAELQVPTTIHI